MTPWLSVVGMGEDGPDGLGRAARAALDGAEVLIGDARLLALVPEDERPRRLWPHPLTDLLPDIGGMRGRPVCVLASGDPLHFGIGELLVRRFGIDELTFYPAPSSFSLACARLGWSRAAVETRSLHNRPVPSVLDALYPGARLLLLTRDGTTPAEVAALLTANGWGESRLTVLERLGGPGERTMSATAAAWPAGRCNDLNVLAVDCVARSSAMVRSRAAGLPDDAYRTDGLLTKREVRAATLAALAPQPGQVLWDVGAGSGSIAIEWLRLAPNGRAFAIEPDENRRALIEANALAFGIGGLTVVAGTAPAVLAGLPAPDSVFIGGGLTAPGLVEACWSALPAGGRLVANAVTMDGEVALFAARERWGGDLVRIAVWRAGPVGGMNGWKPLMPVTQWSAVKV